MLGAPIRQAAANQVEVHEYEARQAARQTNQRIADEELGLRELYKQDEEEEEDLNQQQQAESALYDELIEPDECIKRLKLAAKSQGANGHSIQFKAVDLFNKSETVNSAPSTRLNQSLELLVEPNSVRAIKLIEI